MDFSARLWVPGKLLLFVLHLCLGQQLWASNAPLSSAGGRGEVVEQKEEDSYLNSSVPNYQLYHRSDVFQKELIALVDRHPLIMSMEVLRADGLKGDGGEAYSAEMTVVTVEAGGKGSKQDQNMRLLLDFGEHGRELVTSEVALRLLQTLGGEYPLANIETEALNRILPHTTIKIVPLENLNGRRSVEAGNLCERKNGRGVDTNRNWGVDWGKKEKDYDPAEEYPGTAAFSEPETKILRKLAESFKPHIWVNVHTGMEALFMPYDHKNTVPADGAVQMKTLLQTLNRLHCRGHCVVGSGGGSVGYLAHGTATDYMYDALRVPMAFTWEIYGDDSQPATDCFQMFNPSSREKFETVVSNWSASFLTLLVYLPKGLHSLATRFPTLEVWDWESWPLSDTPEIPDLELRKQLSRLSNPLRFANVSERVDWLHESRLDGRIDKDEEAQLVFEFVLLFVAVVFSWMFFKFCRCYVWTRNCYDFGHSNDRGRRVPV